MVEEAWKIIFSILFLSSSFLTYRVNALIPEVCTHNVTKPFAVCCPRDPFNGRVCGGYIRGHCRRVDVHKDEAPGVFRMDDRMNWPARFFSYTCACNGNYFGIACEHCWFGWKGEQCNIKSMRIKRDLLVLNDDELDIFKDVMLRSQTWPSGFAVLDETTNWLSDPLNNPKFIPASVQYFVTFSHRYGSRATLYKNEEDCENFGILNFNHDGAVFPTWHRYFNLIWEMMLAEIAYVVHGIKDFTVPYWDFVGLRSCDVCTNKYLGAPGIRDADGLHLSDHSIFRNFTEFCFEPEDGAICFGCQYAQRKGTVTREFNSYRFPDQEDLKFLFGLRDYFVAGEREINSCKSFHMALEGFCGRPTETNKTLMWMHNRIHLMIDGSMCCSSTATNDPLFIVLHSYVDKIFNTWIRLHGVKPSDFPNEQVRPGHARDTNMIGLLPLVRNVEMFVDSRKLGYDYDDNVFGKHTENGRPPLVVDLH